MSFGTGHSEIFFSKSLKTVELNLLFKYPVAAKHDKHNRTYLRLPTSVLKFCVNQGTVQGAFLGTLHFITYVNDLENVIKTCEMYQFADTCIQSEKVKC